MANEDLIDRKTFCVVCTKEVPTERTKFRSVTCSEECTAIRQRLLRKRVDDRECRFCHKASTPTQRKAFSRFRRWEREHPDLAYPEVWAIVSAAGVELKEFGRAVHQTIRRDVMLDVKMADLGWGSTKGKDDVPTPELDRVLEILRVSAVSPSETENVPEAGHDQ
jgi:hypothetical protein